VIALKGDCHQLTAPHAQLSTSPKAASMKAFKVSSARSDRATSAA
jgi:hypothetical protein